MSWPEGSFAEANAHVTHVMSLTAQAARDLVGGLLEALEGAGPDDWDDAWRENR